MTSGGGGEGWRSVISSGKRGLNRCFTCDSLPRRRAVQRDAGLLCLKSPTMTLADGGKQVSVRWTQVAAVWHCAARLGNVHLRASMRVRDVWRLGVNERRTGRFNVFLALGLVEVHLFRTANY